ncbi:MAG: phosphoribosylglycinamide formyltransferase [Bacteroidota bacterium]|jgi:phosphoribosylglycinamide formyltransferase-1
MIRLAILGSGSGSNALNIIEKCAQRKDIQVALVVSNVAHAGILDHANQHSIPAIFLDNAAFQEEKPLLDLLQQHQIDWIILAGFLRKIGSKICQSFPNKIINIHPALLPKYGGKGMYGHHVHERVFEMKDQESGITIHYVNEHYDEGNIIVQFTTSLAISDGPKEIEAKVRALEMAHFPDVIFATVLA